MIVEKQGGNKIAVLGFGIVLIATILLLVFVGQNSEPGQTEPIPIDRSTTEPASENDAAEN